MQRITVVIAKSAYNSYGVGEVGEVHIVTNV